MRTDTDSTTWRMEAACAEVDGELFFGDVAQRKVAIRICDQCPVRRPCLADALAMKPMHRDVGQVRGGKYFPHKAKDAS